MFSGQFTDKQTRGPLSRTLVNLATAKILKIIDRLHYICTPNLTLTLTLSQNDNVKNSVIYWKSHLEQLYTPNFQSNI